MVPPNHYYYVDSCLRPTILQIKGGVKMAKNLQKNFQEINPDDYVSVYNTPRYTEIVANDNKPKRPPVKRISKQEYVNTDTGEVLDFKEKEVKSIESLTKQCKRLRIYISGYFSGDKTERFITLTYSGHMAEPEKISNDFKYFMRKIMRKYGKCRYIYIKEPDEKGSWHIHCIIKKLSGGDFNITEEEARSMWKAGEIVNVKPIYDIDKLSWYFDISHKDKKHRIKYYPKNMRIYEHSRDMKIDKKYTKFKNINSLVKDKQVNYKKQINITSDDMKKINKIRYMQFIAK